MKLFHVNWPFRHDGKRHEPGAKVELDEEAAKPLLGGVLSETEQTQSQSLEPDETWTVAELKAFAEKREIGLGDATKKADILAVVASESEANGQPDEGGLGEDGNSQDITGFAPEE